MCFNFIGKIKEKNVWGQKMKENRFCCICNSKIREKKVDGILTRVCMKCQKITGGYKKEEKYFVKELREYFQESDYYMIESIILILRSYLRKKAENNKGQKKYIS